MKPIINQKWNRYKEVILYLFFGGLAFLVSMGTYVFFIFLLNDALVSNVFSWVITVAFAYVTNRIWVFHSQITGLKNIAKEIVRFYAGRIVTLIMEEVILYIGITHLGMDQIIVKVAGQIVVIIGNYIISKFFCFTKK